MVNRFLRSNPRLFPRGAFSVLILCVTSFTLMCAAYRTNIKWRIMQQWGLVLHATTATSNDGKLSANEGRVRFIEADDEPKRTWQTVALSSPAESKEVININADGKLVKDDPNAVIYSAVHHCQYTDGCGLYYAIDFVVSCTCIICF